ncbi:ELMO domain-containing protein 2 [Agrilus planipennis]|uniref:ELMO domain-containing protein 2 n=1 Tax=Agrilus planipennis TaxID=224129 RepID=A0A1W4X6B1_AGRPL|nr:ELMO domain-containing protein 2 [Agrilus planipennis]
MFGKEMSMRQTSVVQQHNLNFLNFRYYRLFIFVVLISLLGYTFSSNNNSNVTNKSICLLYRHFILKRFMAMFSLWLLIKSWLHSLFKWFLRTTTKLCELQRICYGHMRGAGRFINTERSLNASKSPTIKKLVAHLNEVSDNQRFLGENKEELIKKSVKTILLVKKITRKIHPQFVQSFSECIDYIWSYKQMLAEVEVLRKTPYDADNLEHERRLDELWHLLMPNQPLECRITKQWQEIGFQGDDPKTDFRGMGLLGLENLLYFSREYNQHARHVLSHAQHPTFGYTFAIVGINLTSMALQLCRDGDARTYFYNKNVPSIVQFHKFYCYLFYEFDRFWIECKPKNIMEFSSIRDKFEFNIRKALEDHSAAFKLNVTIDNV